MIVSAHISHPVIPGNSYLYRKEVGTVSKAKRTRGRAIVLLFKDGEQHETLLKTMWNNLFLHFATQEKGVIFKVRRDLIKKGDKPCSCGRHSLDSE